MSEMASSVVLVPAKQWLIPDLLTEQDWAQHGSGFLLLPGLRACLDPCRLSSPPAPAPGYVRTSAPSLGWGHTPQTQVENVCRGDPVLLRSWPLIYVA